eukprot:1836037-Rhodomonas_salina.1
MLGVGLSCQRTRTQTQFFGALSNERAPAHSNPRHACRDCVWPALVGSENLTNVMVVGGCCCANRAIHADYWDDAAVMF